MQKTVHEKIIIHTDGGSRGNPGPSAVGVVIENSKGEVLKSFGKAIGVRTNNEAEYEAVVSAIAKVKALIGGAQSKKTILEIYMDSELVVRQLGGIYKIEEEKLFPLFIKIWNSRIDFGGISFHHVPREKNREADRLVNEALDKEQKTLF
jgi:ribonuclease HI